MTVARIGARCVVSSGSTVHTRTDMKGKYFNTVANSGTRAAGPEILREGRRTNELWTMSRRIQEPCPPCPPPPSPPDALPYTADDAVRDKQLVTYWFQWGHTHYTGMANLPFPHYIKLPDGGDLPCRLKCLLTFNFPSPIESAHTV